MTAEEDVKRDVLATQAAQLNEQVALELKFPLRNRIQVMRIRQRAQELVLILQTIEKEIK